MTSCAVKLMGSRQPPRPLPPRLSEYYARTVNPFSLFLMMECFNSSIPSLDILVTELMPPSPGPTPTCDADSSGEADVDGCAGGCACGSSVTGGYGCWNSGYCSGCTRNDQCGAGQFCSDDSFVMSECGRSACLENSGCSSSDSATKMFFVRGLGYDQRPRIGGMKLTLKQSRRDLTPRGD